MGESEFLKIPKSNYVINSELVVINARTKKQLSPAWGRYALKVDGKWLNKSGAFFLEMAQSNAEKYDPEAIYEYNGGGGIFVPVPSLKGKYLLNQCGCLKRAETNRLLKCEKGRAAYRVCVNGRDSHRTIADLLWEVFGTPPKKKIRPGRIPVKCIQATQVFSFGSLVDCAKFLAPRINYSVNYLIDRLRCRVKEFCGVKFVYSDTLPRGA